MDVTKNIENVGHEAAARIEEHADHNAGREGPATRKIERVTSSLPSTVWLGLAGASVLGSLTLKITGHDKNALFVGQWAPMFMLIGLYNKLVKVAGSERRTTNGS